MTEEIINVYPTALDNNDNLIVPEEPGEDEDSAPLHGPKSCFRRSVSLDSNKSVKFSGVVTAITVARWMAKSYGYTASKKSCYVSRDTVI